MLTLSENKTYHFIKNFIASHEYAPTTAEIAEGIGITSRGVVHRYLKALDKKGLIKLTPNRHRNIILLDQKTSRIPLLGVIAAGSPIEAIESHDTLDILNVFLGDNRYALRVKGDSMIDEGIHDGDIIVCERSRSARDGQIVVALINQHEATLKRLYHNNDASITLLPANVRHQPQTYQSSQVEIQGIYIGLFRLV